MPVTDGYYGFNHKYQIIVYPVIQKQRYRCPFWGPPPLSDFYYRRVISRCCTTNQWSIMRPNVIAPFAFV